MSERNGFERNVIDRLARIEERLDNMISHTQGLERRVGELEISVGTRGRWWGAGAAGVLVAAFESLRYFFNR